MPYPCRVCGAQACGTLLDFGRQPNSVRLLTHREEETPTYPLSLAACDACGFVFIPEPMPPEAFYGEAQQATSLFPARHLPWLIAAIRERCAPAASPLLLEIGSNDGHFLGLLRDAGYGKLRGIEPSDPCAARARAAGLAVETGYFTPEWARALAAEAGTAQVVICRHVLEHIWDLDGFLAAMEAVLAPGGFVVLEVPDLGAIQAKGDLSAVWEQHVNYFDLPVLERLLARFGLRISASHALPHGGGTLLAFLERGQPSGPAPAPAREPLRAALSGAAAHLRTTLTQLRAESKRIVGFGAGMRGTMLLNLSGTGPALTCVLDDNPDKVGRFLPGSRLPIRPTRQLQEDPPDVCLLLPLNSKESETAVMARFPEFLARGGRFLELLAQDGTFLAFKP